LRQCDYLWGDGFHIPRIGRERIQIATHWQTMMKEDSEKGNDASGTDGMNDNPVPSSEAGTQTEKTPKSDISNYRTLLEFFSKEQFVEELRTLNAKLGELQQWHEEWEHKQKALEDERE
jgi:hypothetical protein